MVAAERARARRFMRRPPGDRHEAALEEIIAAAIAKATTPVRNVSLATDKR
jgi:hypothetical protein